ncbi:transcriptional repressor [Candidatus Saccharibacteria bacterium]|nr:transcriptional repressor [Candidatus Saccharibacteria bacterium]
MLLIYEQRFRDALKGAGYKYTPERATLFREIATINEPVSQSDIARLVAHNMAETTVYRNIDIFEKIGVIVRVYTGWKFKLELSEEYRDHHHHMTCTNCGTITDFEESQEVERELNRIGTKAGFIVKQHTLELRGTCQNCQKKNFA